MSRRAAVTCIAALSVAALWLACGSAGRAPNAQSTAQAPSEAHSTSSKPPRTGAASASPDSESAETRSESEPGSEPSAGSQGRDDAPRPGSSLFQKMLAMPRSDLDLLARFEREEGGVPPSVLEIVRRHRAGAGAAELREWAREHGPRSLNARRALAAWFAELERESDGGLRAARAGSLPGASAAASRKRKVPTARSISSVDSSRGRITGIAASGWS